MNTRNRIKKLSVVAIFSAVIVVLQILATFINISGFPITLTLVPIIIGAAVYGEGVGAILGFVFGAIVSIMVVTGLDPSGALMLSMHPLITVLTCLIKGMACGYISGLVYRLLKNRVNDKVRIIISAFICPVINTFGLYISLILFFDTSFKALIGAFVSINFVIELFINVLVAPGLTGLINRSINRYE